MWSLNSLLRSALKSHLKHLMGSRTFSLWDFKCFFRLLFSCIWKSHLGHCSSLGSVSFLWTDLICLFKVLLLIALKSQCWQFISSFGSFSSNLWDFIWLLKDRFPTAWNSQVLHLYISKFAMLCFLLRCDVKLDFFPVIKSHSLQQ